MNIGLHKRVNYAICEPMVFVVKKHCKNLSSLQNTIQEIQMISKYGIAFKTQYTLITLASTIANYMVNF